VKDLQERLTRAFPELTVAPLEELATGFHSVAVETADGIVFRIPHQEGTVNGNTAEHRLLPLVAERLPARIPLPEWRIEPGHPDFPCGAIGYRKLPGRHPATGSDLLAAGLAGFLHALHSISLDVEVPVAWPVQDLPDLEGVLEPYEIERVTRWSDSARNELERFEPALRHGDPW